MSGSNGNCLICGGGVTDSRVSVPRRDSRIQHCPRCGRFEISGVAVATLRTLGSEAVRECLSTFVERKTLGAIGPPCWRGMSRIAIGPRLDPLTPPRPLPPARLKPLPQQPPQPFGG